MSTAARIQEAHRKSTKTRPQDIAEYMCEALGTTLVAHICGVDPRSVRRWVTGRAPQRRAEDRLRTAYQVFQLLLTYDSEHTVRAWFIGLNPQLDDVSPAEAIRAGRLREVLTAAKSFILGG